MQQRENTRLKGAHSALSNRRNGESAAERYIAGFFAVGGNIAFRRR